MKVLVSVCACAPGKAGNTSREPACEYGKLDWPATVFNSQKLVGRIRQLKTDLEGLPVSRAIRHGSRVSRDTGDRLTGGGLRCLAKQVVTESLPSAMSEPFLKTIGRSWDQLEVWSFPRRQSRRYGLSCQAL
jgi:hypothetical protein